MPAFAIVSGFAEVNVTLGSDEAHETLVPDHVPTFGVGVDQAVLLPLAQALVLAFWNEKED